MKRLAALALASLLAAGCLPEGDFRCTTHAACGAGFLCEADGHCSAADATCATGRRYRANDGVASGACVGETCAANPIVELAAGADHACARRAGGIVSCWGRNDAGQLGDGSRTPRSTEVAVSTLPAAASIAAGTRHTCAATTGGAVYCWGSDDAGQLGDGGGAARTTPIAVAGISTAVAVAAGEAFSCAVLKDGTARCWGDNTLGQLGDGGPATPGRAPTAVFAFTGIRALSAGWQHACAVRDDETLWCWGDNSAGQLGDGSIADRATPVQVQTLGMVTSVAAGLVHTCAATRAEGLFCWGDNGAGQLGNEDAATERLPVPVRLLSNPVAVTAGAAHTCAIRQGGAPFCWGANGDGQLGEGSTSALPIPAAVSGLPTVTRLVAGGGFSCAVDAFGALFCWGDDHHGQLGLGRLVTRARPMPVAGVSDAIDVASGGEFSCALTTAGAVCWGANEAGQLGDATFVDRASAAPVKGVLASTQLAAGREHACAIESGGGPLLCWGRGGSGQLGPNRVRDTSTATEVTLPGPARGVAAGDDHTCAALDDGRALCWGANDDGQLGDGTTTARATPAAVKSGPGTSSPALAGVESLTAGGAYTCAIVEGGSARCWGRGTEGQLGTGSATSSLWPAAITLGPRPGTPAHVLEAGDAHACGIGEDESVWCWGRADDGRLGSGDTQNALSPVEVVGLVGARGVTAGGAHSCALDGGGSVWCWGSNDDDQLGGDGAPFEPEPVMVLGGLANVVQLSSGDAHTCARRSDGSVWCWGANTAGQLGDGGELVQVKPQLVRLSCQ